MPPDMRLHGRVQRIMDERAKMADGEVEMDWGFAETMAYASLLVDGHIVRLVGQDSGRGTFFHRHAVLHNQVNNREYIPLASLVEQPDAFRVIDSLLSEEAVLGFEYGYASTEPNTLVIWEGQFGDFVNGAQVVIDQFISSGEAKWGRLCGLTMFLPHGYEGQGPEHSSARLERFLQLCAEHNIQVCVPSTPAQMFHMLQAPAAATVSQAADRHDAEEPAATQAVGIAAYAAVERTLRAHNSGSRGDCAEEDAAPGALQWQGLFRFAGSARDSWHRRHRDRAHRTAVSVSRFDSTPTS